MAKEQSIFKRFEKKYLLTQEQYTNLRQDLERYMTEDEFGLYTICNLYYDTRDYKIIRKSIEKPIYKEKLRVRSYGTPDAQHKIFFELKKKYNKEVFKRRVAMPYENFMNYIKKGIMPDVNPQIMEEIQYFIDLYTPYPRIYLAYDRLALFGKRDSAVRVTFDENIRFRTYDLKLCAGDHGQGILKKGERIMEIKVEGAMPMWLCSLLSKHRILPTSFSKYGVCYTNYILTNKMYQKEKIKQAI